jgi:hypothetical protein
MKVCFIMNLVMLILSFIMNLVTLILCFIMNLVTLILCFQPIYLYIHRQMVKINYLGQT